MINVNCLQHTILSFDTPITKNYLDSIALLIKNKVSY